MNKEVRAVDEAVIEKLVRRTYSHAWSPWLYLVISAVVSSYLTFSALCALLGSPFTYEVDALFVTVTYKGWLDTKPYMWGVWLGLCVLMVYAWYVAALLWKRRRVMRIYTRGCDEALCLRVLRRAVEYGKERRIYRRLDLRHEVYFSLESELVALLCVSGRPGEAREYLDNGWLRRKGFAYRGAERLTEYAEAVAAGDEPRAREAASRLGALRRYNLGVKAALLAMGGDYAAAAGVAARRGASSNAARAARAYFLARCYEGMGEAGRAAENYRCAAAGGGTMLRAQKAREWLAARESTEKEPVE